MFTLLKKLFWGRHHPDNFEIYSDIERLNGIDADLSICVKYKHTEQPDVRFTWKINTNIVNVNNRNSEYVPKEVLDKALTYVYGYFNMQGETMTILSVTPFDREMMHMATIRGTQIHSVDDHCRLFVLHGSSYEINRFSDVYANLPALHMPVRINKFYVVSETLINDVLSPKSILTRGTSLRGILLFPTLELAVLDYIANRNQSIDDVGNQLYVIEVDAFNVKNLIGPSELIKRQRLYDAHVTRAHLATSDVPCKTTTVISVINDGWHESTIRAYDNTITVKHADTPPTIIGIK